MKNGKHSQWIKCHRHLNSNANHFDKEWCGGYVELNEVDSRLRKCGRCSTCGWTNILHGLRDTEDFYDDLYDSEADAIAGKVSAARAVEVDQELVAAVELYIAAKER